MLRAARRPRRSFAGQACTCRLTVYPRHAVGFWALVDACVHAVQILAAYEILSDDYKRRLCDKVSVSCVLVYVVKLLLCIADPYMDHV